MAVTKHRIYRARDGRPVPEGHLDALVLAYAPGDEVPDVVLEQFTAEVEATAQAAATSAAEQAEQPEAKQAKAPANKAAKAPANKADEA